MKLGTVSWHNHELPLKFNDLVAAGKSTGKVWSQKSKKCKIEFYDKIILKA
jgi:hypothetical protein|tara:strand:- start:10881 stop:11033 length:153 start_codon:yes stop_codon:yes gene_type:complete